MRLYNKDFIASELVTELVTLDNSGIPYILQIIAYFLANRFEIERVYYIV